MADQRNGGIPWCTHTWNPFRGCSRISEGCRYCYAEVIAGRFCGKGQPYEGLGKMTADGARWTGEVRLIREHLEDPIRWKRPRRIFVNSMSDLFHESLDDASIAEVFRVMFTATHHTFQTLTKRTDRMLEFLEKLGKPLPPHIWLGISVENQKAADDRIPMLCDAKAAVRWLSIEPQLGPITLKAKWLKALSWVIIGGESGPNARNFDISWARALIAQCKESKVAVFMKQLGESSFDDGKPLRHYTGKGGLPEEWPEDLRVREYPAALGG